MKTIRIKLTPGQPLEQGQKLLLVGAENEQEVEVIEVCPSGHITVKSSDGQSFYRGRCAALAKTALLTTYSPHRGQVSAADVPSVDTDPNWEGGLCA